MTFGAVLSGSSHFSVYLMTIFSSDASVFDTVLTVVNFGIFWIQLIAAAEVNNMVTIAMIQDQICNDHATPNAGLLSLKSSSFQAGKIAKILRNRYQEEDDGLSVTRGNTDDERKATRGLMMLLANVTSKSVGFHGLRFFTVSYSLIGSVRRTVMLFFAK